MAITQREAQRLKKRVRDLEKVFNNQKRYWSTDWPEGVQVSSVTTSEVIHVAIKTARKLGHAVVVTSGDNNTLYYHALPL